MSPSDAAANCGYLTPVSSWDRSSRFVIGVRNAMFPRLTSDDLIRARRETGGSVPAAEDLGDVVYPAIRGAKP